MRARTRSILAAALITLAASPALAQVGPAGGVPPNTPPPARTPSVLNGPDPRLTVPAPAPPSGLPATMPADPRPGLPSTLPPSASPTTTPSPLIGGSFTTGPVGVVPTAPVVDPRTGQLIDPATGALVDPRTRPATPGR